MIEYDLVIYPRKLWVEILCKETIKSVCKNYNYIDGEPIPEDELKDEKGAAYTLHCERKKDGKYGIVVLFSTESLNAPYFAHEAFHVIDCIVNACGLRYVNDTGNEHIAYLIQYVVSCFEDWFNKQIIRNE